MSPPFTHADIAAILTDANHQLANLGPDPDANQHVRELLGWFDAQCAIWACPRPHRSHHMCTKHWRRHQAATRRTAALEALHPTAA